MQMGLDFVGMSYEEVVAQYADCYEEEDFVVVGDVYGEHYELDFEDGVCVESVYCEGED